MRPQAEREVGWESLRIESYKIYFKAENSVLYDGKGISYTLFLKHFLLITF